MGVLKFYLSASQITVTGESHSPGVVPRRQIWGERDGIRVSLLRSSPIAAAI